MARNFALTGAAGFVAVRHLKAIRDTGNRLVAALDPHDSVGILDSYFQDVSFFTEFERFDRHLEKLRLGPEEDRVNYLSICSPNHLHDAHIRLALRVGADAICEKPLVIKPWNLDALARLEEQTGQRICTVLQLRLHPALVRLRTDLAQQDPARKHDVCLTYVTARGPWYRYSWKGDPARSGGLATNIGVHLFDMLLWCFGGVRTSTVHLATETRMAGFLDLDRAAVRWFLSIERSDLPFESRPGAQTTYRSVQVDGADVEFSEGFGDLHTEVYREVIAGRGFGIEEARPALDLVHSIRAATPASRWEMPHPFLEKLR